LNKALRSYNPGKTPLWTTDIFFILSLSVALDYYFVMEHDMNTFKTEAGKDYEKNALARNDERMV